MEVLARRPLAAAAGISAALWTLFFLLFSPRFATNDDPLIAMLPAGTGFAAAPDEHLIFTNVLIGLALKRLYAAAPGLPWYGLYLLATHALAQTALLYAALRAGPRASRIALYLLWFAVAAVPFANNLQFTVTAFVAAQSGLLLAIGLAQRRDGGGIGIAAVAAALAFLGSLIRFEAYLLVLALAAPAAVVIGWGQGRRTWARPAAAIAASLVFALGAHAFDSAYYARSPGWAAYREFNRTLAQFVDFKRANEYTPQTAAAFRAVGWSRNDHRLLLHWFHPEGDVFGTAKLEAVLAQTLPPVSSPAERLGTGLRRVFRNRPGRPVLLALPLALLACATVRVSRRAILAGLAASVAVLIYLIVFLKAPPHVFLPVLAWPLALALVLPAERGNGRVGKVALGVAALVAAGAAAHAVAFQRDESAEGRAREKAYVGEAGALAGSPERLYVLWSTFPYHVVDPLAPPGDLPPARFLALGWPQRTPATAGVLAARGHVDLIAALADPHTRLVAPAQAAAWVEQYAERHHGLSLQLVPEATVAGLAVLRPVPSAGAAADRVLRSEPPVPE